MNMSKRALVVVAHPDDETLWAGGAVLGNAGWTWTVLSLCRRNDPDRAPRFYRVLQGLGATGFMGDLDDGPDQVALSPEVVEGAVTALLPSRDWDVVYTHSPFGEYTRHRRHEEIGRAVHALWTRGEIITPELRMFAYEDGGRDYLPRAIDRADVVTRLPGHAFRHKCHLITGVYGFAPDSWEARAVPRTEAFWRFRTPADYDSWFAREEQRSDTT